jgi:outer membrane protein
MMVKIQSTVLILIGLWASGTQAVTTGAAQNSLQQLIKQGLDKSFTVQSQQMKLRQSEISYQNTWSGLFPTLTLSAGETSTQTESLEGTNEIPSTFAKSRSAALTASWKIWDNFGNIRNIRLGSLSYQQAELNHRTQKQEYALKLIDAFFNYHVALNKKTSLENFMNQAKSNLTQAQLLVKVGARTELDALDAEVEYLNAQRDSMEFENKLNEYRQKLQIILSCEKCNDFGQINLMQFQPHYYARFEEIRKKIQLSNISGYIERNPAIKQNKLSLESAIETHQQERLNYWPQLSFTATHTLDMSRQIEETPTGGRRENLNTSALSLNLSWTLWDWWATPRNVEKTSLDKKITENQLRESIQQAKSDLELSLDQLEIIQKSLRISALALEKAEKQIRFSQDLYRFGKITLLQVQQSMSKYLNAQNAHADRLKDKYVLSARILTLLDESILP